MNCGLLVRYIKVVFIIRDHNGTRRNNSGTFYNFYKSISVLAKWYSIRSLLLPKFDFLTFFPYGYINFKMLRYLVSGFVCLILRMKLKADKIAQRVKNQILCKCDTMSLIAGTHGEKRELILKSCPRPLDTCHGTYMLSCTQNIKIKRRPKLNIEKKHY